MFRANVNIPSIIKICPLLKTIIKNYNLKLLHPRTFDINWYSHGTHALQGFLAKHEALMILKDIFQQRTDFELR